MPLLSLPLAPSLEAVTASAPFTAPWLRLPGHACNIRLDPQGKRLAFTDASGNGLTVLDLQTRQVLPISKHHVGPSFFWAPDGIRLFYRELVKTTADKIQSNLKAYDAGNGRQIAIDVFPHLTGLLTFDPRDLRMHLLFADGIHSKQIYFPDQNLARWQVAQRTENGKYVASQKGVLWLTNSGFAMHRLDDDGTLVNSFNISPDGSAITWATIAENIYISQDGGPARRLHRGTDPVWHPQKPLIAFAAARVIGNKIIDYDLAVSDLRGSSRFLTSTPESRERWPAWRPKGDTMIYTRADSTDLYELAFNQQ